MGKAVVETAQAKPLTVLCHEHANQPLTVLCHEHANQIGA